MPHLRIVPDTPDIENILYWEELESKDKKIKILLMLRHDK